MANMKFDILFDELGLALSYGVLMGQGAPVAAAAPAQNKGQKKKEKKEKKKAPPPKADEEDEFDVFGDEEETKKVEKPKKKAAADEDDEMDLFGDEGEEEEAAPVSDRAKKAAELKAKRDAEMEAKKKAALDRLAKKEAKQRSLCNLEIKPWEAEQDLMELFNKIKTTVVKEGLKWSENCALKEVAFGIKKMILTAVINQSMSMDAIIEEMLEEVFPDEIQSMEMTSMSLL